MLLSARCAWVEPGEASTCHGAKTRTITVLSAIPPVKLERALGSLADEEVCNGILAGAVGPDADADISRAAVHVSHEKVAIEPNGFQ